MKVEEDHSTFNPVAPEENPIDTIIPEVETMDVKNVEKKVDNEMESAHAPFSLNHENAKIEEQGDLSAEAKDTLRNEKWSRWKSRRYEKRKER